MNGPPTPKATLAKRKGRCGHHPKYRGATAPQRACAGCWRMFLTKRYDAALAEAVLAPKVLHLDDTIDIAQFIAGLKTATKSAKETGGSYSAFVQTKSGERVRFDVWLKGVHGK